MNKIGKATVRLCVFLIVCSAFQAALAQQNEQQSAEDPKTKEKQKVEAVVLKEIVVVAHKRDYRVDSADTALGLDIDIVKTPAAISVITEDLLKDQQVNNVDDALRNVEVAWEI